MQNQNAKTKCKIKMPNTKTGGTVPDLVQEAERAWEKEQESTNKGNFNWNLKEIWFISNIYDL